MRPLSLVNEKTLIWGHRGARSLAAENTLRAMRLACEAGADGWEFDVQLSKDGELIVLHDLNLLRSTNAKAHPLFTENGLPLPWRFTLKELRKLSADIFPRRLCPLHSSDKPWLNLPGTVPDDVRIPTLTEVLELAQDLGMWLNIEIKDLSRNVPAELEKTVVKRVHDHVSDMNMSDKVILSSFNHSYMAESKRIDPKLLTGLLTSRNFKGDPIKILRENNADSWNPSFRNLTEEKTRHVRNAGFAITPYTVNEIEIMQKFVMWGVTGLITDTPQKVPDEIKISGQ